MTLWSCKVKKEDKVGAGPQKMEVKLFLIEQYAGQSNTIRNSVPGHACKTLLLLVVIMQNAMYSVTIQVADPGCDPSCRTC